MSIEEFFFPFHQNFLNFDENNDLSSIMSFNTNNESTIQKDLFLTNNRINDTIISYPSNNINISNSNHTLEERNDDRSINSNTLLFKVKKQEKRGRKVKNLNNKIHGKDSFDNLLSKIQVHFMSFVINLSNDALKTFFGQNTKYNFKNISYKIKQKSNFDSLSKNKKSTIGTIIFNSEISEKYKKFHKNINKETLQIACGCSKWLNNFFNNSFLKIFRYYYNKNQKIPLKKIEFEGEEINLSSKTQSSSFCFLIMKDMSLRQPLIETVKMAFLDENILSNKEASFITKKSEIELKE